MKKQNYIFVLRILSSLPIIHFFNYRNPYSSQKNSLKLKFSSYDLQLRYIYNLTIIKANSLKIYSRIKQKSFLN